mgnify:CR=1 FL=1
MSDNQALQIFNNQFIRLVDNGNVNRSEIYLRGGNGIMPERVRDDIDRYVLRLGDGRPSMAGSVRCERNGQLYHSGYDFKGFVYVVQRRLILLALVLSGAGYDRKQVRRFLVRVAVNYFLYLFDDLYVQQLAGLVAAVGQHAVLDVGLLQERRVYE